MTVDPLLGAEVGRYRITREIGEGGMGRVYEATRAESGAVVAIKVLADRYAQDASLVERFFAEARAANLIAHDGIVKVHDLATLPDGRPYIVMERLVGKSLRRLLDEDPPPLGGVLQMMLEVLSALGAAHEAGIVHRDLKPDNIFVTAKGRAKLLDFGVAKLTGAHAIARTQTGVVLGTPEYMAPEHITDGICDARSDVYAAGVVLFEALAGKRPFDGASDFELMRAHVSREPPRVRSLRPALPQGLDDIIHRALSKRPADRFSSARSMANALHHASAKISLEDWKPIVPGGRLMSPRPPNELPPLEPSDGHRPPTLATVSARPPRQPPRRRWIGIAAALVLTSVAGIVVAVRLAGSGEPGPARTPVAIAPPRVVATPVPIVVSPVVEPVPTVVAPVVEPVEPLPADRDPSPSSGPRSSRVANKPPPDTVVEPAKPVPARTSTAFDAGDFDVLAFMPAALALARERAADAGFAGLALSSVRPNGRVVLGRAVYRFTAPSLPVETCEIHVIVTPRGTSVTQQLNKCGQPISMPRCTTAQVREKARVLRTATSNRNANLTFDGQGWAVFTGQDREWLTSITDGCTPSSWASTVSGDEGEAFEVERALTDAEKNHDFKQVIAGALALARKLDPDAKLVRSGMSWSRRTNTWSSLGVSYFGKACVQVSVNARTMRAERPPNCVDKTPIPMPRCTPEQIAEKVKDRIQKGSIGVIWEGDQWLVTVEYQNGNYESIRVKDDC